MGVLSKLAQVRLYSSYGHKWDNFYTCTATTGHFVSKDLGKVSVTCHKIHHLHPCSNSPKARVIAGYTMVTDGRWCTKKRGKRVPWRGEWIVERLGHASFSYFIIVYSCPSDPNTQDPMKDTGASYFSCTSELPLHSPIKGKLLQQKQHSRLNALI